MRYRKNFRRNVKQKIQQKKVRKLDMHKTSEFTYQIDRVLTPIPENVRGTISGSIYAKASRIDIYAAKEFVLKKKDEGIMSETIANTLINLLFKYSKYR